jgi:hypothetical protein
MTAVSKPNRRPPRAPVRALLTRRKMDLLLASMLHLGSPLQARYESTRDAELLCAGLKTPGGNVDEAENCSVLVS